MRYLLQREGRFFSLSFFLVIDSYHKHTVYYRSRCWSTTCTFLSLDTAVSESARSDCTGPEREAQQLIGHSGFSHVTGDPPYNREASQFGGFNSHVYSDPHTSRTPPERSMVSLLFILFFKKRRRRSANIYLKTCNTHTDVWLSEVF